MAGRQIWKNERKSSSKYGNPLTTDILSYFQLWRLVIFEPVGVQRHNVPHFKGLISADSNPRAQGHDGTFTFCHALVKKSILHLEMATVPFFLNTAVLTTYLLEFLMICKLNYWVPVPATLDILSFQPACWRGLSLTQLVGKFLHVISQPFFH